MLKVSNVFKEMSSIRITRLKFILVFLVVLVFSNEWITFMVKTHSWQNLSENEKGEESLSVLIVADPQILSIISESSFPFNYVAVWDANRFVSRSFHLSLAHSRPDIIIFLGDLINDGSISSQEEFQTLVKTFRSLFPISSSIKVFYIPGDNDIGGEREDKVTSEKVLRFNEAFNVTNRMHHKFLNLIHINIIPGAEKASALMPETPKNTPDDINVVVSHLPLLPGAVDKTMHKIRDEKPSLIISAHDHDSYKFVGKKSDPKAHQFWVLREDQKIWEFDLNSEDLVEISAPTCSYRMGQQKYGFGYGLFTKSGVFKYTILWLPSRFSQLWCYFWGLCLAISFLIYPILLNINERCNKKKNSSSVGLKYHNV